MKSSAIAAISLALAACAPSLQQQVEHAAVLSAAVTTDEWSVLDDDFKDLAGFPASYRAAAVSGNRIGTLLLVGCDESFQSEVFVGYVGVDIASARPAGEIIPIQINDARYKFTNADRVGAVLFGGHAHDLIRSIQRRPQTALQYADLPEVMFVGDERGADGAISQVVSQCRTAWARL